MAIRYLIWDVVKTNLKKKSVIIRLSNTQPELSYREIEVVLPREVDEVVYLKGLTASQLGKAWERATPITDEAFEDAKNKTSTHPFFESLVGKVFDGLQVRDLDTAYSQVVSLLNDNPEVKAQFVAIQQNLQMDIRDNNLPAVKREQLLWFLVLALLSLVEKDD